jgi:hypothetical protein
VITLDQTITELDSDLVALDPFVKTHNVGENNNDAIDAVAQVLTDMAHKHDIGVDAPHHTSKGQVDPGNAQKGRGASALVDAARLVYTLAPMSAEEGRMLGIPQEECRRYIRLDSGKVNITPTYEAKWFKLVGVPLGNASALYPNGDNVQTVEVWKPPSVWADMDVEMQNAILDTIDAGLPDGRRYSDHGSAKDRAAWRVIQKHAPDKKEGPCREIIKKWIADGVIKVDDYDDPEHREKRKGLFVNADKRPK